MTYVFIKRMTSSFLCMYCGEEIESTDKEYYARLTEEHFEEKACPWCYTKRCCRGCLNFHESVAECTKKYCKYCCRYEEHESGDHTK